MKTDNSIASFWHMYTINEKAAKRLSGRDEAPAYYPLAEAGQTDESPDSTVLEAVECHP